MPMMGPGMYGAGMGGMYGMWGVPPPDSSSDGKQTLMYPYLSLPSLIHYYLMLHLFEGAGADTAAASADIDPNDALQAAFIQLGADPLRSVK